MEKRQTINSDTPPLLVPYYSEGSLELTPIYPEQSPPWSELSDFFNQQSTEMPLMFSRPEYQLETLFYYVCREHSVPSVAGSVYMLPVTLEVISTLKPDLLVSQPELASILLGVLVKKGWEVPFTAIFLFPDTDQIHSKKVHELAPHASVKVAKHPLDV